MTGQQLKNSILQMAVQGKLVPQDPNDEPASVLLERIRKEKEQLIKEGKIKKDKNPSYIFRGADNLPYEKVGKNEPVCIADEVPFEIPESWEWVRLSKIVYNRGQMTPADDFCYIDIGSIDNQNQKLSDEENIISADKAPSRARKIVAIGDILYSTVRPYLHNMCIVDRSFSRQPIASTGFAALTCHAGLYNEFLFYYLMSPDFDAYANDTDNAKGVAYPAINDNKLYQALIPVPPEAEQKRIVEKIKEVLPYVDTYRATHSEAEYLNNAFPDQLKKSILQEAVKGKLVPQDPADEPASVLLDRIRAEKEQLIKAGKIKRDKHESVIFRRDNSHYEKRGSEEFCIDEELPFDLPDTWSWARLGELCSVVTGRLDANAQTLDGEYAFFTCGREVFRTDTYAFDCDAILLGGNNASGDYKMHRYSGKFNAYQRVYVISGREPDFLNYLYYVITFWLGHLKKNSQGTTTRFIKLGQVTGMLVPVPPCAEQKRITQTMQLLLSECDRLQ